MNLNIKYQNLINFQASKRKTKNGNEYLHTNNALAVGGTTCALATGLSALITHKKKIPNSKKTILAWFGLTAPLILMGAIADKLTNKQRQKAADLVAEVGVEQAQLIDKNLEVAKNGNLYKPTANGTMLAGIGVVSVLVMSAISHALLKKGVVKKEIFKHFNKIFELACEMGGGDELAVFIGSLPATLPFLPLIGSDWLNKKQSEKFGNILNK